MTDCYLVFCAVARHRHLNGLGAKTSGHVKTFSWQMFYQNKIEYSYQCRKKFHDEKNVNIWLARLIGIVGLTSLSESSFCVGRRLLIVSLQLLRVEVMCWDFCELRYSVHHASDAPWINCSACFGCLIHFCKASGMTERTLMSEGQPVAHWAGSLASAVASQSQRQH